MLATGSIVGAANLYGVPPLTGSAPLVPAHALLLADARVTIAWETKRPSGTPNPWMAYTPGWELVRAGEKVGWVQAGAVKRDPMLAIDAAHRDYGSLPRWKLVYETPGFCIIMLKATEGTRYQAASWYVDNMPRVIDAAGDRWGDTAFAIPYHYYIFGLDPVGQARYFWSVIKQAGGLSKGHLWPVYDVERADNPDVPAEVVIRDLSIFERELKQLGCGGSILYAGEYLRSRSVKGSQIATPPPPPWVAEYNDELKPEVYQDLGYSYAEIFAWQYAGDQPSVMPTTPRFGKLPHGVPALGHAGDASIILGPSDFEELRRYRWDQARI